MYHQRLRLLWKPSTHHNLPRFPAVFSDIFAKIRHEESTNKWVGFEEFRRIQFKAYLIPPLSALGNCRWFEPHAHNKDVSRHLSIALGEKNFRYICLPFHQLSQEPLFGFLKGVTNLAHPRRATQKSFLCPTKEFRQRSLLAILNLTAYVSAF